MHTLDHQELLSERSRARFQRAAVFEVQATGTPSDAGWAPLRAPFELLPAPMASGLWLRMGLLRLVWPAGWDGSHRAQWWMVSVGAGIYGLGAAWSGGA
jgi:hypothetical protein